MVQNVDFGRFDQIGPLEWNGCPVRTIGSCGLILGAIERYEPGEYSEPQIFEIPEFSPEISGKVPQNLSLKWSKTSILVEFTKLEPLE